MRENYFKNLNSTALYLNHGSYGTSPKQVIEEEEKQRKGTIHLSSFDVLSTLSYND